MKIKNHLCLFVFLSLCLGCNENVLKRIYGNETESELIERALSIHKKVLTLDTHFQFQYKSHAFLPSQGSKHLLGLKQDQQHQNFAVLKTK